MSQNLKTIVIAIVTIVAWLMKTIITVLIRLNAKPQDVTRRLDEVDRNYLIMLNGANMLKAL
jgi:hypothetical protein